ncbi:MAG TPA: ABC transporter ATP-binding protein [Pyrinomonadaceae bacterium]|nr:ABC transporter ATP-binding protein [Pyrinomonadaceae bacterium]
MANETPESDLTWLNHLASLRNIRLLFSMLWDACPWLLVGAILVRAGRAVLPAALLWIPKQIVDGIIAYTQHGSGDLKRVWQLLALELVLALIADLLSQANTVLDALLGERFTCYVATRLIDHVSSLDLATFEDPVFYDKLERVRAQATGRMLLITSIMNGVQETVTVITLSTALMVFSPWLVVLLTAATIPTLIGEARYSRMSYAAFFTRTPQRRALEYLRLLGSWADSAKEVRIFRLASHLSSKYRSLSGLIYQENKGLAIKRGIGGWTFGLLAALGYYAGYVLVLKAALAGAISIGTFTFLTGSLARSRMSTQRVFLYLNGISEQAILLNDLFVIFKITPSIRSLPDALPVPRPIREGFEFRDVSFSYPGTKDLAIRNINFRIRPNESVALIGANGAGKTTLVKLLSRLYDPVGGQILLDGVDLRNYDLSELRSVISVLFQDFMRYDLSVRENIGFGNLSALGDDQRLQSAATRGGAAKLIDRFPLRYDQMLGRRYKDGIDLSGGEWQKIALSRAFVNDTQLLILDEPTASLDARAEDQFFKQFQTESIAPLAILISHRLSTVRMADKIIVLEHGQVREEGTHDDLLKLGGRYAELFNLQAAAFF